MTEVFPYIFGRVGGTSFKNLLLFEQTDLYSLAQEYNDQCLYLCNQKNKINIELYHTISKLKDVKSQKVLLNLKRDVYNNRDISNYMYPYELADNVELNEMLGKYIYLQKRLKALELSIDNLYNETIVKSVQLIKETSTQFFLRNGLIFSSDSLYENLNKFTLNIGGQRDKKEMRMALSLLRYLTRSAAKTSPFSGFNSIFALKENDNVFVPIPISNYNSKLSINNLIYLLIKKIVLSVTAIKKNCKVYLNPTLENTEDIFKYFYNKDNNEGFRNVQKSDILSFIIG
ncbi:MAG: hypothetical protein M3421_10800, partial [Bacteroidota bacterium]|nr:hypothetical protein [Bacteroidota bacterium]